MRDAKHSILFLKYLINYIKSIYYYTIKPGALGCEVVSLLFFLSLLLGVPFLGERISRRTLLPRNGHWTIKPATATPEIIYSVPSFNRPHTGLTLIPSGRSWAWAVLRMKIFKTHSTAVWLDMVRTISSSATGVCRTDHDGLTLALTFAPEDIAGRLECETVGTLWETCVRFVEC